MSYFEDILERTLAPGSLETRYTSLVRSFESEDWIGYGRNRGVFRRGRVVVKVPLHEYGEEDNCHEARVYRMQREALHVARCRLVPGTSLLVMEHVKWDHSKKLPAWTDFVDCRQVGRTRRGKLVAFDFGF